MIRNILIIPSNTDLNRGDQALVWETIRFVKDCTSQSVKISLIGSGDNEDDWIRQNNQTSKLGYPILRPILKHPGRKTSKSVDTKTHYGMLTYFLWGWQAIKDLFHTYLLLSRFCIVRKLAERMLDEDGKKTYDCFKKADAIFVKGGGFIHSYGPVSDIYLMYFLLYHINLAHALKKKVLLMPNSIGPLRNTLAKRMALKCLKKCTLLTTREHVSESFVKGLGLSPVYSPDFGFYLKPKEASFSGFLKNAGFKLDTKNVIITARPYRFSGQRNSEILYEKYTSSIASLVIYLVKNKQYGVTLFAHTLGPSTHENDVLAINDILKKIEEVKEKISVINDSSLTCQDVEKIYSYFDYLIGTRFHSVIFGLNVNVPSIAIAYGGNKGKGIMEAMGMDEFCLKIEDVTGDKMCRIFDQLEDHSDDFKNTIKEKKAIVERQRSELVNKVRNILYE